MRQYYTNSLVVHFRHPLTDHTLCGLPLDDLEEVPREPVTCEECVTVVTECANVECFIHID